jgi:aryl-alcohol dehydrogenase-like predicted oxidoreductase
VRYRYLGSTGLKVSEIGFGAWAIGGRWWGPQDDEDSKAALHRALDLGCNFIDTAWVYGDGHSERLIGAVLKERGARPVVATKVPPKNWQWDNKPGTPLSAAFPADWVREKCEESLAHLGVPQVEVLQLHTWSREWNSQVDDLLAAVERLKRDGKIRAFGLSLRDKGPDEADELVRRGHVDTLQFFFNLLYQEPLKETVPLAGKYGVGLIARVPMAFGALTGKFDARTRFHKDDHRRNLYRGDALKEIVAKVDRIRGVVPAGMPLPEAAVKWTLAYPQVSTAIPGIRNPRQAEQNCAAGDGAVWPEGSVTAAESLYRSNFGFPVRRVSDTGKVHAVFMSGVALSGPRSEKRPQHRKRPAARRKASSRRPVRKVSRPRRRKR